MRMDRKSWNPPVYREALYQQDEEETTQDAGAIISVGIFGFLVAVSLYGVGIWGTLEILHKQSVIDWQFEPWQPYLLSLIYFVMRSMNRVMYTKP